MGQDRFRNCDPIKLSYEPREIEGFKRYPCWRDYMIFRVSIYFQSQIIGFIVLSAFEQTKSMSRKVPNNIFVVDGYFASFVENVDKVVYWSDKCRYEN